MNRDEALGILRRWADPADAMQVAYEKGLKAGQDSLTAAESRGREAALKGAAEDVKSRARVMFNTPGIDPVIRNWMKDHLDDLADLILSRIPSPSTTEIEGCEWDENYSMDDDFKFCPYCSKPIITAP